MVNALVAAETMEGMDGHKVIAMPVVKKILSENKRLKPGRVNFTASGSRRRSVVVLAARPVRMTVRLFVFRRLTHFEHFDVEM